MDHYDDLSRDELARRLRESEASLRNGSTDREASRLREDGLRRAIEVAQVGIYDADLEAGTLYWSPQMRAILGVPADVSTPAPGQLPKFIHPDDADQVRQIFRHAFDPAGNGRIQSVHRIVRPDGAVRWVQLDALAQFAGEGARRRAARVSGVALDVTERKEAELRLAADLDAVSRLQKIGTLLVREGTPEAILGEVVEAAIAIAGADFGDIRLLDPTTGDLRIAANRGVPPLWIEYWSATVKAQPSCRAALQRGERVVVEDVESSPIFAGAPGLAIGLRAGVRTVQTTPLVSRTGKLLGMFSTHHKTPQRPDDRALRLLDLLARQTAEIIERMAAEDALRESEERLRFALETSHIGAWELDLVDHSAHRSLEHDRIFGYEELCPRWTYEMFLDHVLPEDRAAVDAGFRQATTTGSDLSFECRIRRVDGGVRWIWAAGRHRRDSTGSPRWMAGIVQDITERKRTEESLRQSRADLDRAQEVGQIGWWRMDLQRNVLTWSDENHRIFGVPKGTPMTYDAFLEIVHPDDRQYVDSQWRAGLRGKPYDIEHRIVIGDQVKWVREKAYLELDDKGALLGGFGITQDITERKQVEEALRQSEQRLHLFIEHAPAAIAMFDRHMRYLAASARWRADYRLGPELIGRSHYEIFPEIPERWKEVHRRALAGEVLRAENERFERADGTVQWLIWEVRPWVTATGEVGGILIFTEDITQIKSAEQALRVSEERFQLATEIGRSGTWDWNVRTGEVIWSRGHYELLGYRVGEITPSYAAWADRVHAEDRPPVEALIRRTMAERANYASEFRVVWPDGSTHWISARARYEYAPDGACRRMLGIMADVTELKEAERQARELNAQLAALLAERTQLAEARAAHLRELAVELTQAEQRERDRLYELLHDQVQPLLVGARLGLSGLDERATIETWIGSAAEAREHITAALDTARSLSAELNPPLLREAGLEAALDWLRRWVKTHHGLEVQLKCEAPAEPADAAVRLLLFKAVREALLNVAKHARTDKVSVAMKAVAGRWVQITVTDRGVGFDAAARAGDRNGSGLYDIGRRLGMIGGKIEITSKPGVGTTIRLSAPFAILPSGAQWVREPVTRERKAGSSAVNGEKASPLQSRKGKAG